MVRVVTTFIVDASLSCNILISFCSPSPSVTTRDIACIRGNQSRLLFWNRRWRSGVCSLTLQWFKSVVYVSVDVAPWSCVRRSSRVRCSPSCFSHAAGQWSTGSSRCCAPAWCALQMTPSCCQTYLSPDLQQHKVYYSPLKPDDIMASVIQRFSSVYTSCQLSYFWFVFLSFSSSLPTTDETCRLQYLLFLLFLAPQVGKRVDDDSEDQVEDDDDNDEVEQQVVHHPGREQRLLHTQIQVSVLGSSGSRITTM